MNELQADATRLKTLGRLVPNPKRLAEVEAALSSKWEGTQSLALKILAEWRDPQAVAIIRAFLEEAFGRDYGWSVRGVAVRALASLVGPRDVDWVLDLYFSRPAELEKHELLPLVLSLPPKPAQARLVRELSSAKPLNRRAAVIAIGNMALEGRDALLRPLRHDPDCSVGQSARLLTTD